MTVNTKIEWCDHTLNFWWGCEKVSPGCAHCYAEGFAKRVGDDIWGRGKPRRWIKSAVTEARKLNAKAEREGVRYKVFANSMSDFFEEDHGQPIVNNFGDRLRVDPNSGGVFACKLKGIGSNAVTLTDLRQQAFQVIDECRHLDWLIVTKRPKNIFSQWPQLATDVYQNHRDNVWLLTSVENQEQADQRIPELLRCRDLVPVLGLSMEPLLGPVDLEDATYRVDIDDNERLVCGRGGHACKWHGLGSQAIWNDHISTWLCPVCKFACFSTLQLDWVIVGGESGHHARPMHPDWARDIRDQCQSAGVPFFFKQWGEWFTHSTLDGLPFFRQFTSHIQWVHKASTRVQGGKCLDAFGRECNLGKDFTRARDEDAFPVTIMDRVGKKNAGRTLDGKEWSQFPEVQR